MLVWIHGGGWVTGWKDQHGRGYGLVRRSLDDGGAGVILVSVNYRLGIYVSLAFTLARIKRHARGPPLS